MISQINHTQVALLEIDDIYASYVKKEILRGVSLRVNRSEIVTVLGGNGSGKSTLLKTIAGLLPPTSGKIVYSSLDITHMSVHNRQKKGIGYLLQGGRVFTNLTVAENLEIALKHHHKGRNGTVVKPGAIFPVLLEKSDIRAGLLSGGQRQMLAIEMVLAQEPELLLLDEPTGALSHDLAIDILNTVSVYVQNLGTGVLLVEQNVEEASKVSNRCLRLSEGIVSADRVVLNNR